MVVDGGLLSVWRFSKFKVREGGGEAGPGAPPPAQAGVVDVDRCSGMEQGIQEVSRGSFALLPVGG